METSSSVTADTPARLRVGDRFSPRVLETLSGARVHVPDATQRVHLQLRRFAGCPICSFHLRTFARRKAELDAASVREVVVFHSSADDLRKVHTDLPFDVIPDPERLLYRALAVETSPRAMLDPRAWLAAARGLSSGASADPAAGARDGSFGLPADFLIAPSGEVLAVKYGVHADDQWSLDEVLALENGA